MTDDSWLTDHLLGEGDPPRRARAERRIAANPVLAQRAQELREVIACLEELPAEGWRGVIDAAAHAPGAGAAVVGSSPPVAGRAVAGQRRIARRGRRAGAGHLVPVARMPRRAVGLLVAALVFAVGVGVGALLRAGGSRHTAVRQTVALRPLGTDAAAHGVARLTADGRLHLTVSGLPATGRGTFYEAWLMTSATRLVPVASFRTKGGRATVTVIAPASLSSYRYVDISLQRAAAGLAHSDDSVLRGATRAVAPGGA